MRRTSSWMIRSAPDRAFRASSPTVGVQSAIPDGLSVEFLSDARSGVGTKFRSIRMTKGKPTAFEQEVTDFVPGQCVCMVNWTHGTLWHSTFQVEPEGASTRLTLTMDAKSERLLGKVMTLHCPDWVAEALDCMTGEAGTSAMRRIRDLRRAGGGGCARRRDAAPAACRSMSISRRRMEARSSPTSTARASAASSWRGWGPVRQGQLGRPQARALADGALGSSLSDSRGYGCSCGPGPGGSTERAFSTSMFSPWSDTSAGRARGWSPSSASMEEGVAAEASIHAPGDIDCCPARGHGWWLPEKLKGRKLFIVCRDDLNADGTPRARRRLWRSTRPRRSGRSSWILDTAPRTRSTFFRRPRETGAARDPVVSLGALDTRARAVRRSWTRVLGLPIIAGWGDRGPGAGRRQPKLPDDRSFARGWQGWRMSGSARRPGIRLFRAPATSGGLSRCPPRNTASMNGWTVSRSCCRGRRWTW